MSEAEWIVDRVRLYELNRQRPELSTEEKAAEIGRSTSWVRKWQKRQAKLEADDSALFLSQSREPQQTKKLVSEEVEAAILEIRDNPPVAIRRVPGPVTILYFLHQRDDLKAAGYYLPRSTSTIWQILDKHQRIYRETKRARCPEPREEPMEHWQMDYKSVSTVPPEDEGKQQHVVETLNCVDKGSSILVAAVPRSDYGAETTLMTLVDIFSQKGCPRMLTMDRDPRFVGSWSAKEFPSPLMRFLLALGIDINICPAQRPDKNAFVERYHRSYNQECLQLEQPHTVAAVIEVTTNYQHHYNYERPNQAITCGNQPPRHAFPHAAAPFCLPTHVDPDAWLHFAAQRPYPRRINSNGSFQIGHQRYYLSRQLAQQTIWVRVLPHTQEIALFRNDQLVKCRPLKGLYHGLMTLDDYIPLICREAALDARSLSTRRRRKQRLNRHSWL